MYTDGKRLGAYEPTSGTTLVLLGGVHVLPSPDPPGCNRLIAVGSGLLLYACDCPPDALATVLAQAYGSDFRCWTRSDPTTWSARYAVMAVGGTPRSFVAVVHGSRFNDAPAAPSAIGRVWLSGTFPAPFSGYLLDWRSGHFLPERNEPASSARDYEDLDTRVPLRPLCQPLRRPRPSEGRTNERFQSLAYDGGSALAYEAEPFSTATLMRCGSRRTEPLVGEAFDDGTTPESPGSVQLGAGIVSWISEYHGAPCAARLLPHGPHLYGVVQRFVPRRSDGYYGHTLVTHTATTLYASSDTAGEEAGSTSEGFHILAARIR